MNYKEEYLNATNTNPELVVTREPEKPIKLQIDKEELKRVKDEIYKNNH